MKKRRKTGGRIAGTPNKTTSNLREVLSSILEAEISKIPEYFEKLDPEQRIHSITRLLPYVIPKKQEMFLDQPEEPIKITMNLGK